MTESITNKHGAEIRVGQVWADNDRRSEGRTVKVVAIEMGYRPRARCVVLTSAGGGPARSGRETRIAVDRMRPVPSRYQLVGDGHMAHHTPSIDAPQGTPDSSLANLIGQDWLAALIESRFRSCVSKSPECWEWTGAVTPSGYGRITHRKRKTGFRVEFYAHRISYELHRGAIPEGLVIDHLCRNRKCVNPEHLEPVSNRENILRGTSPAAKAAAASQCRFGHPYSGANLYVARNGSRACRKCIRRQQRAAWAKQGPSVRCAGITRAGNPCQHKVRKHEYCGKHGGQEL